MLRMVGVFLAILSLNVHSQIPESKEIDKIFAEWDTTSSPGAALGIIKNGQLIYSRGYGMANLEHDISNSPKTVFRIASTSKQFTAASIILLVQQGKLKLEDPLTKFYPEFPEYAKKITIRHLLNHTSGIRDYLSLAYLSGNGGNEFYTDKEVLAWLVNQKTNNFEPGEKFLYSNSGYWLLGQIVEKASGINMADYANREIFTPLKMYHTHFHNNHNRVVKNRASGYSPAGVGQYEINMTTLDMIGDGGIFTTIEDMKIWDDAYYQSDILNEEFWNMMEQVGSLNTGEPLDYAAGLVVREHNGLKMVGHGGAFVGYRAEYVRFPQEKFSIILFANRSDARPAPKAMEIADLFLAEKYKEDKTVTSKDLKQPERQREIQISSEELEKWVGDYWYSTLEFSRSIALEDNTLFYERAGRSTSKLIPIAKNKFVLEEDHNSVIEFSINEENKRMFSFSTNNDKPDFAIAYSPVKYNSKALKAFQGEYFSEELQTTYKLSLVDKRLSLSINGNEPTFFKPIKEDLWLNDRFGAFYFERGKNKKVASFTLSAGRVRNLKFIKL